MEIVPTGIEGAYEVRLKVHSDERGQFKRLYCERLFREAGLSTRWVQQNHSVTHGRGSARGLHYQTGAHREDKLVSCAAGRAFDVAVDLRRGSPTYLQWAAVEIDERTSFYIPKGCAHGFQALEEDVRLVYLASEYYAPEAEAGIRLDDPLIGVDWPLPFCTISWRDRSFELLAASFEGVGL